MKEYKSMNRIQLRKKNALCILKGNDPLIFGFNLKANSVNIKQTILVAEMKLL